MFRGNKGKVMKAAAKIAAAYRGGDISVKALCARYGCAYDTLMDGLLSVMTFAEYERIKRKRHSRCGKPTQFRKGQAAWNKGRKGMHLSPDTEFKKGGPLRGVAARNWRPVGTITIRYDKPTRAERRRRGPKKKGKARRWIKFRDHGRPQYRWMPYARWLWQKRYGPVPAGLLVAHIDGDQLNDAIANLTLVDRRRNLHIQCHSKPEVVARRIAASASSRRSNTLARRAIRRLHRCKDRRPTTAWYCPACGATWEKQPPRCPKCGASALEKISVPA